MAVMEKRVRDIMSSNPVTVSMDDRLGDVRNIFNRLRFHHVLVVDEGKLFGVLSDRDLLKALSPNLGTMAENDKDAATLNKRVHQVMTRKPITVHGEDPVMDAVRIFNTQRISCIPVIDADGRPVGLLSWRDILRSLEQ